MAEQMTTGACEAIRIAEMVFPDDLRKQKALAKEIIGAINLCEAEFAQEIIRQVKGGTGVGVGTVGERSDG